MAKRQTAKGSEIFYKYEHNITFGLEELKFDIGLMWISGVK